MKNQPKNKTSLLKSLILLFIASFYTACDEQTVYHSFQSLPTEGWQRNDTLFFNVSVADSATLYNVSVEVRNRNNYPYQNLPLLIYYDSPDLLTMQVFGQEMAGVGYINQLSQQVSSVLEKPGNTASKLYTFYRTKFFPVSMTQESN